MKKGLILLVVISLVTTGAAAEWTTLGADGASTNYVDEPGAGDNATVAWEYHTGVQTGGYYEGSHVAGDGRIYVVAGNKSTDEAVLAAVDPATGTELWSTQLSDSPEGDLTYIDETLVFTLNYSTTVAYHADNGTQRWERDDIEGFGGRSSEDVLLVYDTDDQTVYNDTDLLRLHPNNGTTMWSQENMTATTSFIGDDHVWSVTDNHTYILNRTTGQVEADHDISDEADEFRFGGVLVDDELWLEKSEFSLSGAKGHVVGIGPNGTEQSNISAKFSPNGYRDGVLHGQDLNSSNYRTYDISSGDSQNISIDEEFWFAMALDNGDYSYVSGDDLVAIENGSVAWTVNVAGDEVRRRPIVYNGATIVLDSNGTLTAVGDPVVAGGTTGGILPSFVGTVFGVPYWIGAVVFVALGGVVLLTRDEDKEFI